MGQSHLARSNFRQRSLFVLDQAREAGHCHNRAAFRNEMIEHTENTLRPSSFAAVGPFAHERSQIPATRRSARRRTPAARSSLETDASQSVLLDRGHFHSDRHDHLRDDEQSRDQPGPQSPGAGPGARPVAVSKPPEFFPLRAPYFPSFFSALLMLPR